MYGSARGEKFFLTHPLTPTIKCHCSGPRQSVLSIKDTESADTINLRLGYTAPTAGALTSATADEIQSMMRMDTDQLATIAENNVRLSSAKDKEARHGEVRKIRTAILAISATANSAHARTP